MPNLTSADFAFQDRNEFYRRRIVLYPFVCSMVNLQNHTSTFPLLIAQVSNISSMNWDESTKGPRATSLNIAGELSKFLQSYAFLFKNLNFMHTFWKLICPLSKKKNLEWCFVRRLIEIDRMVLQIFFRNSPIFYFMVQFTPIYKWRGP